MYHKTRKAGIYQPFVQNIPLPPIIFKVPRKLGSLNSIRLCQDLSLLKCLVSLSWSVFPLVLLS